MTFEIRFLDDRATAADLDALAALLEAVEAEGASVEFPSSESPEAARAYWHGLLPELRSNRVHLATAWIEDGLVGAAQLVEIGSINGRHRAEIAQLIVDRSQRRRGIDAALLRALELRARERGRTTLVLEVRERDALEPLGQSLGWTKVGSIPDYTRDAEGRPQAQAFYFKLLDEGCSPV